MKIDVPVVKSVDVLLVGGSLEGVKNALEAKAENRSVFCVTPYTYLGDDLCAHFDFQSPKSEAFRYFFGDAECMAPMRIKSALERRFMESGIGFFYQTHPVEPVYDSNGNVAGLLVANRSGFQIIAAKVILDATERSLAARACGVPCKTFVPGKFRVERFVMGQAGHDSEAAIEKLPAQFEVEDRKYDVFKVSKEFFFAGNSASDFARAEVGMRRLTWTPELVAASDLCRVDLNDGVADDYCPAPSVPVVIAGRNCGEEINRLLKESVSGEPCCFSGKEECRECDIVRKDSYFRFSDCRTVSYDLNRIPVTQHTEVVVVGGGTGGASAVIAAARSGAKTLCLESLWELGGICTAGRICTYWYGNPVGFTHELDCGIAAMGGNPRFAADSGKAEIEWKKEWLLREADDAGAEIQFGTLTVAAAMKDNVVCGVVCAGPSGVGLVKAGAVIDSTGNADVAAAAGAETRHMAPEEASIQGAGLPPVRPGGHTTNTDYQFICEHDVLDLTRAFVMGRSKFESDFDLVQIADTRERRRIVGDLTLQPQDFYGNRCYSDTVTIARSNFDTHGFIVHPMFMLKPTAHDPHFAKVPFRALLPKGLEGILVTGLGISAHRDCMPLVRMQPDVQNQGYAAGLAAAMAVQGNVPLRGIPMRELQKKLAEKEILPPGVLTENDCIPGPDVSDPHHELAAVFLNPEQWIPVLKKRYAEKQALEDAALLAFLGETDGVSRLEREIEKTPWDEGWNYKGMGQFGASMSPLDTLLFALSTVADSPVYEKKLRDLKPDHAFSHFRAVCRALMRHPHKECAGMLETLLRTPGMAGWAQKNLADTVRANRAEVDDTTVRNSQLKELYLAKALAACDPSNPFAASILKDYADGLQGVYAIFAR